MDATEFRKRGKEMVDYVADYLENIRDRKPLPDVQPGYLRKLIPEDAPEKPDKWEEIVSDIERVIMPGVTHWHHPHFHAYFSTANSYPALIADILSDGIGCLGFSWMTSPACTELEVVMMDWLAKLLQLPKEFMSGGKGGGVIQGTASEATLMALLAARSKQLQERSDATKGEIMNKLVAYCSDQSHSSVEKACLLGAVKCHKVPSDDKSCMRGDALKSAIESDKAKGLIPFFCVTTLGTTSSCAFDNLQEVGPVCREFDLWLHIDAAYAGSAFICPDSDHYWMEWSLLTASTSIPISGSWSISIVRLCGKIYPEIVTQKRQISVVHFDNNHTDWFKDSAHVVESFNVGALYLKHDHQGTMPDFRHWHIPFGRRFRSLKLWFVMRAYGVTGLQEYIRRHVQLAHEFEALVQKDERFEVTHDVIMGLVCFRLKQSNEVNEELHKRINADGRIHLVPSIGKDIYFLRFAICAQNTDSKDIVFAWETIVELAEKLYT